MGKKTLIIPGVVTTIFLLTVGPALAGVTINATQPTPDEKSSNTEKGPITIEYQEYFTKKITRISYINMPQEKIENLRENIEKIEELYGKRIMDESHTDQMINTLLDTILDDLQTWNIFPMKNRGEKLLLLLQMGKHWNPLRRYLLSKSQCDTSDSFLFNINCRLLLFGRLVEPDLMLENYIGFKLPWYIRYREHFKPGCLITYDGLLKNDMILGDFWITGRWFRGFWINIGFPGNYLDFTIGWTAYIMARQG